MYLIVLNLDRQPERMARWPRDTVRFAGVDAGVNCRPYQKKLAICQTYARVLDTVTEPTVICQDDITPIRFPDTFDGFTVFNRAVSDEHACPKMIGVTPDIAPELAERFRGHWWACRLTGELAARGEVLV